MEMESRELCIYLEQEDGAAGLMYVTLDQDSKTGILEMKQNEIIQRLIEVFGRYALGQV